MSSLTEKFEAIRYDKNKKNERIALLKQMSNSEIDKLIENTHIIQGKIALSKFKK